MHKFQKGGMNSLLILNLKTNVMWNIWKILTKIFDLLPWQIFATLNEVLLVRYPTFIFHNISAFKFLKFQIILAGTSLDSGPFIKLSKLEDNLLDNLCLLPP